MLSFIIMLKYYQSISLLKFIVIQHIKSIHICIYKGISEISEEKEYF